MSFLCDLKPQGVDDIQDAKYPTLDYVLVKAEEDRVLAEAKVRKNKRLEAIAKLASEYEKIIEKYNCLIF